MQSTRKSKKRYEHPEEPDRKRKTKPIKLITDDRDEDVANVSFDTMRQRLEGEINTADFLWRGIKQKVRQYALEDGTSQDKLETERLRRKAVLWAINSFVKFSLPPMHTHWSSGPAPNPEPSTFVPFALRVLRRIRDEEHRLCIASQTPSHDKMTVNPCILASKLKAQMSVLTASLDAKTAAECLTLAEKEDGPGYSARGALGDFYYINAARHATDSLPTMMDYFRGLLAEMQTSRLLGNSQRLYEIEYSLASGVVEEWTARAFSLLHSTTACPLCTALSEICQRLGVLFDDENATSRAGIEITATVHKCPPKKLFPPVVVGAAGTGTGAAPLQKETQPLHEAGVPVSALPVASSSAAVPAASTAKANSVSDDADADDEVLFLSMVALQSQGSSDA